MGHLSFHIKYRCAPFPPASPTSPVDIPAPPSTYKLALTIFGRALLNPFPLPRLARGTACHFAGGGKTKETKENCTHIPQLVMSGAPSLQGGRGSQPTSPTGPLSFHKRTITVKKFQKFWAQFQCNQWLPIKSCQQPIGEEPEGGRKGTDIPLVSIYKFLGSIARKHCGTEAATISPNFILTGVVSPDILLAHQFVFLWFNNCCPIFSNFSQLKITNRHKSFNSI